MSKHKKRTAKSLIALLLAAVMAVGTVPAAADAATSGEIQKEIDALEEKNAEIQAQIDAIQSQYDANYSDMADIVAQKEAIDQEIALLSSKIETTNAQISAYSQLIADTQDDLDDAEEELRALSEQHRDRVRAMEEGGGVTYWEVIFEANSFTDLLDRMNMMQEISDADQRRLQEMRIAADIVTATRISLESEKTELESTREELAETEALLEKKRTESDEVLRELEKKSEEYELLLEQSEILQDDLMREIAAKEKELKQAKYDEYLAKLALQGENPPSNAAWVTPVSGYTLTSPFGMRTHPVLGYQRMHNGIDMACPQGTPIYATRAGTVTVASYQAGGAGYYVSINHLDGFASIYMHMTNYVVSAGQSVSQGQLIGYVGSTGLSTGPHLHFGISYAGTYVNPLAYIY
ncbi:MAG: murein hydrolase activator EnvC family protein [Faecousia sp.]